MILSVTQNFSKLMHPFTVNREWFKGFDNKDTLKIEGGADFEFSVVPPRQESSSSVSCGTGWHSDWPKGKGTMLERQTDHVTIKIARERVPRLDVTL